MDIKNLEDIEKNKDDFLKQRHIITSERINYRRKMLGLTLEDLAQLTKISRATLQRYESGDVGRASIDKLIAIASALEVSMDYLMGFENIELPLSYYKNILPLLNECGYEIQYDDYNDNFTLEIESSVYAIEISEIKALKDEILSYTKYKLIELLNKHGNK